MESGFFHGLQGTFNWKTPWFSQKYSLKGFCKGMLRALKLLCKSTPPFGYMEKVWWWVIAKFNLRNCPGYNWPRYRGGPLKWASGDSTSRPPLPVKAALKDWKGTPWKFNIAPENIPSQKESSLPTIIFQRRTVKLREGIKSFWKLSLQKQVLIQFMSLYPLYLKVTFVGCVFRA